VAELRKRTERAEQAASCAGTEVAELRQMVQRLLKENKLVGGGGSLRW